MAASPVTYGMISIYKMAEEQIPFYLIKTRWLRACTIFVISCVNKTQIPDMCIHVEDANKTCCNYFDLEIAVIAKKPSRCT